MYFVFPKKVVIDLFPDTAAIFVYIFLAKDCWMSRGHVLWCAYVSVKRVVVLVFFTL